MASRANVENVVIHRLGALMAKAGFDGTTVDGTNADLNQPISWAVHQVEGDVADVSTATDAEVVAVADASVDELLDYAELKAAEDTLGNLDDVDTTVGPVKEALSQLAKLLEKRIETIQKRVERLYGHGTSDGYGVMTLNIAQHGDDD